MKLEELNSPSQLLEDEKSEAEIEGALEKIERKLPHEARFKRYSIDMENRIIYWVTQEQYSFNEQIETADTIQRELFILRYGLWTVKVCVRDEWKGDNDDTPWAVAESL